MVKGKKIKSNFRLTLSNYNANETLGHNDESTKEISLKPSLTHGAWQVLLLKFIISSSNDFKNDRSPKYKKHFEKTNNKKREKFIDYFPWHHEAFQQWQKGIKKRHKS